jgi:predicted RNA polymerase sigma factor
MDDLARRTAESVAREAYGRLLAYLAVRERNVATAEDALAEAFAQALAHWPTTGVPERPEAWLLTVARRGLLHSYRHAGVQRAARARLDLAIEEAEAMARSDQPTIPDERLALFFVCAHPAIDPSARAPLMLQTVLGIDAATIARAFLVGSATLGQRLVRAKRKIAAAGIAFRVPDKDALAERLEPVLDGIYAAYGTGWAAVDGGVDGLAREAIWLGRVLASLLPDEPEALGLLALMLYAESRRAARFCPDGAYTPLAQQDVGLWRRDLIDEADRLLRVAGKLERFGRFQCEAAIQAVHAARRATGVTDWPALRLLHDALLRLAPTIGGAVSRAAVVAETGGPAAGLAALAGLVPDDVQGYQPYWAVRADLLRRAGDLSMAREAYDRAIALSPEPAIRRWLAARRDGATPGQAAEADQAAEAGGARH